MKRGWLALVMLVPLFAGCLTDGSDGTDRVVGPADPGYDAEELRVTGVATHDLTIQSGDAELSAVLYEPLTEDSIDGEQAVWPLVVFVHPWGFPKETYENAPLSEDGQPVVEDDPRTNILQTFAEGGVMAIAYDTRGWGETGGQSTVVGPAEMRDLRTVIDHVTNSTQFPTNGHVGVTGASYGGLHAYRAWAEFDEVDTVVPHNAGIDLYEALFPGNVPKLEFGAALYGSSVAGGGNPNSNAMLNDWMATGMARESAEDMDGLRRQLDARSILMDGVTGTDKPIFVCQALSDTLFPQAHHTWMNAPNFTRAQYYTGGHNTLDAGCWDQTLEWFRFFLAGIDTEVDTWPFLQTVDLSAEGPDRTYAKNLAAAVDVQMHYLREGKLVDSSDPTRTFTIQQQVASNPLSEPAFVWETTGQPYQQIPEQFRQDPSGVFFESAPLSGTHTLLGAPQVVLELADGTETPFQVVATFYHKQDGSLRILGRGATSPLAEHHLENNSTVTIDMPWIKADVGPGDSLVLELASSDPNIYAPLFQNFAADFTGESRLDVPFFAPPPVGG